MKKIKKNDINDFYLKVIEAKNNWKNRTNMKVLMDSLNSNLDEYNILSSKQKFLQIYKNGNEERILSKFIRTDIQSSYEFHHFICKELNDYIFSDRKVQSENPVYRNPVFLNAVKGLSFVIASHRRKYDITSFDHYGRIENKNKETVPVLRVAMAHTSRIKQMLFSDMYSFNIIKDTSKVSKDIHEKIENYLPLNLPKFLNNFYHISNIKNIDDENSSEKRSNEDEENLNYEIIKENLKTTQKHDVSLNILRDTNSFEKVIVETTILQELYEELLLNIENRFKLHKENNEDKKLKEELKVFRNFIVRNSIFLDAFFNLSLKNHIFMDEMHLIVLKELGNGYFPYLTNFNDESKKESDIYYERVLDILKGYKVKGKEEDYLNLLLGITKNITVNPIPIQDLSSTKRAFLIHLKDEIDKCDNLIKLSVGVIFNKKYPLDLNNTNKNGLSLVESVRSYDENCMVQLKYEKRESIKLSTKDLMSGADLKETAFLKCKYQNVLFDILKKFNYDLILVGIDMNNEMYHVDIEYFYKNNETVNDTMEISFSKNEIEEKELVKLIEVIVRTINNYVNNNINNITSEEIKRNISGSLREQHNIMKFNEYKNENYLGSILLEIPNMVNDEFIDCVKGQIREEELLLKLNEKPSLKKESRKKI